MIDLMIAFVHPITLALLFLGAAALDAWLIDRRRSAPPPDTP